MEAGLPDVIMDLTPPTSDQRPATTPPSREALQALMWDNVGIVRNADGLKTALAQLRAWQSAGPQRPTTNDQRPAHELRNMVTVGQMMAEAALTREESRGAHYRTDFPDPRDEWRRHIVFRKQ